MNYNIIGKTVPSVEFQLNKNESIYTQSGAMSWKSRDVKMETNTKGGIMRGIGRAFSGDSLFMNTYTAESDNQTVAFSSTVPGSIIPYDLTNTPGIIGQKGAFLCAEDSVTLKIAFTKKLSAGLFGGEGFILQEMTGTGNVFLEIDGDEVIRELSAGESILVDTGNVVAFEKTVQYEIETIKGFKNILFGGEGLFLTKLTGPGKIILQTMNFGDLASKIIRLMPPRTN